MNMSPAIAPSHDREAVLSKDPQVVWVNAFVNSRGAVDLSSTHETEEDAKADRADTNHWTYAYTLQLTRLPDGRHMAFEVEF